MKIILALVSTCFFYGQVQAADSTVGQPNIIVVMADDLGFGDIGAYRALYPGGDAKPDAFRFTPHLDRLAKQGVRCTRAYACSWCAPSRLMLLSGQWANRAEIYDHPWIGKQLRDAGYRTCLVGKSHGVAPTQRVFHNTDAKTAEFSDGLFFNGGARGYYLNAGETFPGRHSLTPFTFTAQGGEHLTDVFTDHADRFIREKTDTPFFLYLAYTAPHEPLQAAPADLRKLFPDRFANMTDDQIRATAGRNAAAEIQHAHYAAMVHGLDRGIGRLMATLEELGLAENTLVMITSDNGAQHGSNFPLSGHKWDDLEGGIRVPFIIWSHAIANSDRPGLVYDGLVSLADIVPTAVTSATGMVYQNETDGIDLLSAIAADSLPTGRQYYWANAEYTMHLSGLDHFSSNPVGERLFQCVLIRDREKVILWNANQSGETGAVYSTTPDVVGDEKASSKLAESTPVAGNYLDARQAKDLLSEMRELVRSSNGGLLPEWNGTPEKLREAAR
ncbi:sulfatase family protein [Stieleria varia]|uniref:Arylsulfatase n=1 Tax=Stieleria varia TaxID=2528005 RepID=A0A5C6B3A0_9BACT|nr:sulfatase-like hydrolase/transferase [Stieleria varia]TWU05992.1 Arylsulfatase precursor [Stieleria varia]